MIELQKWCSEMDVRKYLKKPFNCSDRTVATNGCILIAVKKEPGHPVSEKYKSTVDTVLNIDGDLEELNYLLSVPDLSDCEECSGKGLFSDESCRECDGDGEVDFENAYHKYSFDCLSCDGSGRYRKGGSCEACKGDGKAYAKDAVVTVAGVPIQPKYFTLLKELGPGLMVHGDTENWTLYFKNKECNGAIMGYRFSN